MGIKASGIFVNEREAGYFASVPKHDPEKARQLIQELEIGTCIPISECSFGFGEGVGKDCFCIGAYDGGLIIFLERSKSHLNPESSLLQKLKAHFPKSEILAFSTYSTVNHFEYALYKDGQLLRAYAGNIDDDVYLDVGELQPEEKPYFENSKIEGGKRTFYLTRTNGSVDKFNAPAFGETLVEAMTVRFLGEPIWQGRTTANFEQLKMELFRLETGKEKRSYLPFLNRAIDEGDAPKNLAEVIGKQLSLVQDGLKENARAHKFECTYASEVVEQNLTMTLNRALGDDLNAKIGIHAFAYPTNEMFHCKSNLEISSDKVKDVYSMLARGKQDFESLSNATKKFALTSNAIKVNLADIQFTLTEFLSFSKTEVTTKVVDVILNQANDHPLVEQCVTLDEFITQLKTSDWQNLSSFGATHQSKEVEKQRFAEFPHLLEALDKIKENKPFMEQMEQGRSLLKNLLAEHASQRPPTLRQTDLTLIAAYLVAGRFDEAEELVLKLDSQKLLKPPFVCNDRYLHLVLDICEKRSLDGLLQ